MNYKVLSTIRYISYKGYKLKVTTEDFLLKANCKELGYILETPNGYDRLISMFQETVDDYLKLKPYIQELDRLAAGNYSETEVDEKLSELLNQYGDKLNMTLKDVRWHYNSRK